MSVDAGQPAQPYYFQTLDQFVAFIRSIYQRRTGRNTGQCWCPTWWRHAEAVYRFDALWRAWESLRINRPDTGIMDWLVQYADPTMAVLLSSSGPFRRCSNERGHQEPKPGEDTLEALPRPDEAQSR
ncbi:DUF4913 domain-containing protein [Acidipropionibacterium timonense]|uniref:DUF4913 domain-containing protein n=1 Tax=Acidipropionibacterium timonense TaxID=2161818 RepID=UPI00102FD8E0|nr:DUF4913 domain-containing protein [Acidipropionibacterium timonense]